jgi:tripartite-type tricarboxylate transporter receptor subunit TctC
VSPETPKPIRLVLGFSQGSASDQIARTLAPALERELGTSIQIELRPGQNGAPAAADVAASKPDGSVLFMATLGTHALAPNLSDQLPYDAIRDFAPVSLVARGPLLLACHASVSASSVSELIAHAREHPGALSYGTSAIGGAPHLAAELFQSLAGIEMRHARYDHTARLYDDLEHGRIDVSFNNIMSMLPRCREGRLKALAVTSRTRTAIAPDLPAIAESGLPDYEVTNWVGIVAPKATPDSILDALASAVQRACASSRVQDALLGAGVTPSAGTHAEFSDFIAAEIARWRPIVERFQQTTV